MNTIKIKEQTPFKSSIYDTMISNANTLAPALMNMPSNYRSARMTNVGGWQSPSFQYNDHEFLQPFINIIQVFVSDLYKRYDVNANAATLDNYWVNINPPNSYNTVHNHPFSYFSTVLYIKVPPNSGDLNFSRPDDLHSFVPFKNTNEYNKGDCVITPEENMLLMFPSNLKHSVGMNRSNDIRISIALNWR
jgi:uncharacterized protein (TIGR02466 family)